MTVGELIELLKTHDSSRIVVMSIDDEGSGYQYLDQVSTALLSPPGWGRGLHSEDEGVKFGEPALCLWPKYEEKL